MKNLKKLTDEQIEQRIQTLHDRLQEISDMEVNAALVNGYGAKGEFEAERTRILKELDDLCE